MEYQWVPSPVSQIFVLADNSSYYCDDGTLPPGSYLANWGPTFVKIGAILGKRFDTGDTTKSKIEAAGIESLQEKLYKVPLWDWANNPVLREAGKFNKLHILDAMEGYAMPHDSIWAIQAIPPMADIDQVPPY